MHDLADSSSKFNPLSLAPKSEHEAVVNSSSDEVANLQDVASANALPSDEEAVHMCSVHSKLRKQQFLRAIECADGVRYQCLEDQQCKEPAPHSEKKRRAKKSVAAQPIPVPVTPTTPGPESGELTPSSDVTATPSLGGPRQRSVTCVVHQKPRSVRNMVFSHAHNGWVCVPNSACQLRSGEANQVAPSISVMPAQPFVVAWPQPTVPTFVAPAQPHPAPVHYVTAVPSYASAAVPQTTVVSVPQGWFAAAPNAVGPYWF